MNLRHAAPIFIIIILVSFTGISALAQSDIDSHRDCVCCGMDRKAYGYSRMLIQYEDGSEVGVCSLRCALIEIDAHKDRRLKALLVADRNTRTLIDADKAVWVLGGRKGGVMTRRAKWAFASNDTARKFIESYGGNIVAWDEALAAAREDLANEFHYHQHEDH
jgi:copper chaperone NosL